MRETTPSDWVWLQDEVRAAAAAFGVQLQKVPDTSTLVPNLDWSVADLGRHLASLASLYRAQHQIGEAFVQPTDWPSFSAAARSHITSSNVGELRELIAAECETLLEDGREDPNAHRFLYGRSTTPANIAASFLTELVLHGRDLGLLTGDKPTLSRRQATAGIKQQMALTPAFVDPEKLAKLSGTYGFSFRGGDDYTFDIADGHLEVSLGRPDKADARTNAAPEAFLMVSLGRMSPVRAGLTGKIIGYGRKPWRLIALGNAAVDGV